MRDKAAFWIPEYLAAVGYRIVPVPVDPCDEPTILGEPIVASVTAAGPVDVVSVFLRPERVPEHLEDLVAARPPVVWFQSGLLHRASAARLASEGIRVAHACIGCRRAAIPPATAPLWASVGGGGPA
jgi:hypothetical protein